MKIHYQSVHVLEVLEIPKVFFSLHSVITISILSPIMLPISIVKGRGWVSAAELVQMVVLVSPVVFCIIWWISKGRW